MSRHPARGSGSARATTSPPTRTLDEPSGRLSGSWMMIYQVGRIDAYAHLRQVTWVLQGEQRKPREVLHRPGGA
jgi:hypothetical protein